MTASVAILDSDKKVTLIYSASTMEAVMQNVAETAVAGIDYVENPPENVKGGLKFEYDSSAEEFSEI